MTSWSCAPMKLCIIWKASITCDVIAGVGPSHTTLSSLFDDSRSQTPLIICSSLSSSWTMTSANVFVDVHDSWHVSRWLESCPRRYEMRGSWYLRSLYWMRSAVPFLVQTPRAFNSRRSWASCCSYHLQGNRSTFVPPDSAFSKSHCISLSK